MRDITAIVMVYYIVGLIMGFLLGDWLNSRRNKKKIKQLTDSNDLLISQREWYLKHQKNSGRN